MIILFDLDGTVIDSTEAIVESFYFACDKYGFNRPAYEEITALIGFPLDVMFREVGVEEEKVWDFVSAYKEHYRIISKEKTFLLPGAKEAIIMASEFARLGVVTTKTARYSQELLEHFGIMHYFETLIGREDVTHPKPHKEPIEKALLNMGISKKKDVYIIGDTILDLEAAKNANILAIGVLSGYGKEEELKQYGFLVAKNVYEAVEVLKKRKNNTYELNC
ncbi:MAG: HAD family hydrolase [Epsilonproteobacteria bacterium]|nr:HAD family hydrolase [Campylobacterota bacterium]